jgi:hypothetical protein
LYNPGIYSAYSVDYLQTTKRAVSSAYMEDEYHYLFECTEITMAEPGGFLKNADVDQIL